jgi:hypothetical protein
MICADAISLQSPWPIFVDLSFIIAIISSYLNVGISISKSLWLLRWSEKFRFYESDGTWAMNLIHYFSPYVFL